MPSSARSSAVPQPACRISSWRWRWVLGGTVGGFAKAVYTPIFGGASHLLDSDGLLGGLLGKSPKAPKLPPPPKFDNKDAQKAAQQAALMKKKAAEAGFGVEDTIKNAGGAGGLGGVQSIYQGNKTLTGT